MVPVVTGTCSLGAPLSMDFSTTDSPPASHNESNVHSWLNDTVEAHQLLLDKIVVLRRTKSIATSSAHSAFRLMITCAARLSGFLLRTLPR
jgi:hypothetical protein